MSQDIIKAQGGRYKTYRLGRTLIEKVDPVTLRRQPSKFWTARQEVYRAFVSLFDHGYPTKLRVYSGRTAAQDFDFVRNDKRGVDIGCHSFNHVRAVKLALWAGYSYTNRI